MELTIQPITWRRMPLCDAYRFGHERSLPRCIGGLGGRIVASRIMTIERRNNTPASHA